MTYNLRKSGITVVGDLPAGCHFCQFYKTKKDLTDIFIPYLKAGMENNELCVWVTSKQFAPEDAERALKKAIPEFAKYTNKKQIEIIPFSKCHSGSGKQGKVFSSLLDKASNRGFDGLRLACCAIPAKERGKIRTCFEANTITGSSVIALFAYPREKFDAIGIMEVVKMHKFALIRNADRWEVIESSEARTLEGSLRISEERLKQAQEIAHLGGWELDLVNNNLTWSDEVYRIFGLKPQEFSATYEAFLEAVHPEDRNAVNEAYSNSISGGKDTYEIEHRVVRKSTGEIRYVHEKCQHFRDETGKITKSVGMVHDITERRLMEDSLIRAKEEWELTFDSVPDLIAIIDNNHRILRVNKPMAKRLGLEPGQCVGLPCYKYVHGLNAPPDFCPHSKTVKSGCYHATELHEDRLGGDVLVTTNPLFDGQGKLLGSVHVARDITERKQAEEEIKKLNEELKLRVLQLESANKELDAFSYSVSHDLRSPLRSVSGFSQALMEDYADKLDAEGRDSLQRIHAATQRMGQLIDDLLNLSRVSRSEMSYEKINLSDMAVKIADRLRKTQPERNAEFKINKGLIAFGDSHLLNLVLENLLSNAWKFTEKHPKAIIEFGIKEEIGPIGHIRPIYYVKDDGAGFDMKYSGKLFSPFQRLHPFSEFPGTGIGLATVKRIIERHGGKVWIEGEEEKGTTVFFTL